MHYSVLLHESIEALAIKPDGIYIDGTFGRGGHATEILKRLSGEGRLIAFDRDPRAVAFARETMKQANFTMIYAPFSSMGKWVEDQGLMGKIDGIILDLGVSSPQLDEAERGFSFMRSGPLDMRMDPDSGRSARDVLIEEEVQTLCDIFRQFGEERHAWRIANVIKAHIGEEKPLDTTTQLAELIAKTIGKKEKKHPATRVFQALRIYVNNELGEVESALADVLNLLRSGGRLSVISFHSLEDRLVKNYITRQVKGADREIPRGMPMLENEKPKMSWIVKKKRAGEHELDENVRSRSAILRAAEKL
ncbi:MAG: 16S rRNA (cytosine(1402)-N(4))-methyltransferase RsmH [Francisellaceae bacterium]